jgi:O-antigen/teichoic acid export membrane protein
MGLVLVGYLAREFDVGGLGSYNLVVAYTGLFSLFADFGLIQYLTRELASHPDGRESLLRRAAVGSLAAGTLAFLMCNGVALAVGYSDELLRWILIASLPTFLGPAFIAIAMLNATLRGRRVALLGLANQAFGVAVVLAVVLTGSDIETLIVVQAVQSLVYALLIAWSAGVWAVYRHGWHTIPLMAGLRLVWAAVPLGAMAIIASVYYRLDTFLLSVIDSEKAVGYYSAAWRLTEALHIVPAALAATMLPLAAWRGGLDPQRLGNAIGLAFRFMALIGVPIVVGSLILAEPILEAVYGSALTPAAEAFRILIVTEFIFFFAAVASATLVGLRLVRRVFISQLIVVPLNAAACVLVLPSHSYNGAAWISLGTEVVVGGYLLFTLRGALAAGVSILPLRPIAQALVASAPMAAIVLWLQAMDVPLIPTILLAASAFALAVVAVGGLKREDLRLLSAIRANR